MTHMQQIASKRTHAQCCMHAHCQQDRALGNKIGHGVIELPPRIINAQPSRHPVKYRGLVLLCNGQAPPPSLPCSLPEGLKANMSRPSTVLMSLI